MSDYDHWCKAYSAAIKEREPEIIAALERSRARAIDMSDTLYDELFDLIADAAPCLHSCGQYELREKIVRTWLPKLLEEISDGADRHNVSCL